MPEASNLRILHDGAVATIQFLHSQDVAALRGSHTLPDVKLETAEAIHRLGLDNSVRVIVLTGTRDEFKVAPRRSPWVETHGDPEGDWDLIRGVPRFFQEVLEAEKPIVAKVNGDAVGFGSSIVYACDFIFVAESARLIDHHLGMGEEGYGREDFGVVAGDGGMCFVPLFLSPAIAREYLFLGKPLTGADLVAMHAVNGAPPLADLDAVVDGFVQRLLARPQYALAWSKRVFNRRLRQQMDLTVDASLAYEMLNFYQGAAARGLSPTAETGRR